ncbi:MAG: DUF2948 family protein [Alphaproteobacteria bacterium]|nr:DUF2948 family protein [Alphaproteobacteria bacterium]
MADTPTTGNTAAAGPSDALRLRAEDGEDLAVISACLQDALVPVRDLAYDRDGRTFILVANRFRWEARPDDARAYERVLCGVAFDAIDGVAYRGFRRNEEDRILALLAIRARGTTPDLTIDLEFAAGATIRLSAAAINCRVRDFGEPWPTSWQPGHETGAPE